MGKMMLTPRLKQILGVMLQHGNIISVKQLAEEVGVSKRTVQRELEYVTSSLKPYDVTFGSKTGVGVWIEGSEEAKKKLSEEIFGKDNFDTANREERRKRLILEILKEKGLKKLFVYSSKFKVSEATISSDLEAVESWLNQHGMYIIRKPGSGIYVEGTEQNYRKAISTFIQENMNTEIIWEAYGTSFEKTASFDAIKKSGIGKMLEEDTLHRVMKCIVTMNHGNILSLTENSYMGLMLHIAIAINRIIKGDVIEPDQEWIERFEEDEDYMLAEDIIWSLEEEFDIEIPEMEITYICLHIKGAKHERVYWEGKKSVKLVNGELRELLNDMIYAFDPKKAYLFKRDEEFIQGLLAHLQPSLIRMKYDLHIENPILEGVKRDYLEIFLKCRDVAKVIETHIGKPVPEAEVGFLTVHFGAALVRMEGKLEFLRPVRVAVICSSGIGISRLMSSKLEKIFQDRMIIKTYGKRDLTPYEEQQHDFCISSISLEEMSIPVLFVNPLLNDEDIDQIRKMLNRYERTPEKNKKTIGFDKELDDVHVLATQVNKIIKDLQVIKVEKDITFLKLLENIASTLSPYEDRQEVIQFDLLEREKIATQIYGEFGFALLHARSQGVVTPMFHVWLTKDLKPFEVSYFKGISIVFVMLVPIDDNLKINTDIMGHMSSMLIEDAMFLEIVKDGNYEEIQNIVSIQLKKYFAFYLAKFNA
ncbi:MAG: BglG family transcription antiterminator [Eubacteriales bacterium]